MNDLVDFLRQIDRSSAAREGEDPFAPFTDLISEEGFTFCAPEGGRCGFEGAAAVRYGTVGQYSEPMIFEEGVDCSNAVFGDPAQGQVKQCEFIPLESLSDPDPVPDPVADGSGEASSGAGGGGSSGPLTLVLMVLLSLLRHRRFRIAD